MLEGSSVRLARERTHFLIPEIIPIAKQYAGELAFQSATYCNARFPDYPSTSYTQLLLIRDNFNAEQARFTSGQRWDRQ